MNGPTEVEGLLSEAITQLKRIANVMEKNAPVKSAAMAPDEYDAIAVLFRLGANTSIRAVAKELGIPLTTFQRRAKKWPLFNTVFEKQKTPKRATAPKRGATQDGDFWRTED